MNALLTLWLAARRFRLAARLWWRLGYSWRKAWVKAGRRWP
jgi:hypothetical protein